MHGLNLINRKRGPAIYIADYSDLYAVCSAGLRVSADEVNSTRIWVNLVLNVLRDFDVPFFLKWHHHFFFHPVYELLYSLPLVLSIGIIIISSSYFLKGEYLWSFQIIVCDFREYFEKVIFFFLQIRQSGCPRKCLRKSKIGNPA